MKHSRELFIAAISLGIAAWTVLAFLEGDACADAGGSFNSLVMQCYVAPHQTHIPLVARSHWPFWFFYGITTIFVASVSFAILSGITAGLRSVWIDVIHGRSKA